MVQAATASKPYDTTNGLLPHATNPMKICVVDTGYDNGHPDLPSGSAVTGTDVPNNGAWDISGQTTFHSHGTHCAGTIAAIGSNDRGVVGVIPGEWSTLELHIGKGLGDGGSAWGSDVLLAVEGCVAAGSKVISMSLGSQSYSGTADALYSSIYENDDVLVVAAAGNGGSGGKS